VAESVVLGTVREWFPQAEGSAPSGVGAGAVGRGRRGVFTGEALQDFLDLLLRSSPLLKHNRHLFDPPRVDADGRLNPGGRGLTFRDFKNVQDKGRVPDGQPEERPAAGRGAPAASRSSRRGAVVLLRVLRGPPRYEMEWAAGAGGCG